jgi:hypothetical protein
LTPNVEALPWNVAAVGVTLTEPVVFEVTFAEADAVIDVGTAVIVELSNTGRVLTAAVGRTEVVRAVASATGQTVVPMEIVEVTTRAGQSVTAAAQLVTV